jgi:phosphotriesterase-related protein
MPEPSIQGAQHVKERIMSSERHPRSPRFNRREAIGLLGVSAGFGLASAWTADIAAFLDWRTATSAKTLQLPRGAIIRTLLKDISPDTITGATLFHEHLSIDMSIITSPGRYAVPPPPGRGAAPAGPAPSADVDLMVEEVKAAAQDGVSCIVDGGHPDMGRRLENLKQIAQRTSVHIVASGGYYMDRSYPPEVATKSEDQLANELAQEATTQHLGAFGEIGADPNEPELTPAERKVFRAVGKAHLRTNLPIFTHNAYGTGPNVPKEAGLRQLDVLESVGVKPERIAIGHCDSLVDPSADLIKQVAKRGAWVGFDRTGGQAAADEVRVRTLLAFFDAGYADRLLLSSDNTGARTLDLPSYRRVTSVFVPQLLKAGVKEEVIHAILVDNSRRFLSFVPRQA